MLHMTAAQVIWNSSMLIVAALAAWRGGWEERTIAFGMVVDAVVSAVFENQRDWNAPQWADLAVDLVYLAVMVWVALKSNRLWPLWAAAFQVIDVVVYLAFVADVRVGAWASYTAIVIWSYLILIVIVVGTLTRRSHPVSRPAM
jgi:hypothetical protein